VPVGGKKQEPVAHEFESVTVNSTISGRPWELSGHWNRMFEQRVIFDYSTKGFEGISSLDGGESLEWCYRCGQCIPVCPVDLVGNYGPMRIHQMVQQNIKLAETDDVWLCTTCMNCLRVCPKEVDMVKIMPAVRETAVNIGNVPTELQDVFEKTFRYGNALGQNAKRRHAWAKGMDVRVLAKDPAPVDVLFYVEDYWSYHPRGQDAAKAFVRIIEHLGVDWAILGPEEKTVGDSQRLAGEKGLFESLVEDVSSTLSKYDFQRIVTPDPHGYNALLNEYPKYGHNYDVLHYTQLLSPLLDKITWARELDYNVTFHDPCYLGRHNGEYDAPRRLLEAIPGVRLTEMMRCKENGYCCGGGGGGMWIDSLTDKHTTERLSERRVREAVLTGADVLAVCCPYEVSRFEDAAKSTGNPQLLVMDIVELMDQAMTPDAG
jgi:Fe-S oxidoreductase